MVARMMGQSMLLTLVNPMTIPGLMECIALIMLSLTKLGHENEGWFVSLYTIAVEID